METWVCAESSYKYVACIATAFFCFTNFLKAQTWAVCTNLDRRKKEKVGYDLVMFLDPHNPDHVCSSSRTPRFPERRQVGRGKHSSYRFVLKNCALLGWGWGVGVIWQLWMLKLSDRLGHCACLKEEEAKIKRLIFLRCVANWDVTHHVKKKK